MVSLSSSAGAVVSLSSNAGAVVSLSSSGQFEL